MQLSLSPECFEFLRVSQCTNGLYISEMPLHDPTGTTWTSPVLGLSAEDLTEVPFLMTDPMKATAQGSITNTNQKPVGRQQSASPEPFPGEAPYNGRQTSGNTPCRWVITAGLQLAGRGRAKPCQKRTWVGRAQHGRRGRGQERRRVNPTGQRAWVHFPLLFSLSCKT